MADFVIKDIWAFIAIDPDDGDESVVGARIGGNMLPMIAADEKRLDQLRPIAHGMALAMGIEIKLVRFTARVDEESYPPDLGEPDGPNLRESGYLN